MSQVIARRYRPQTFEDVIGQEATVQTIRNAIVSGRIAHGFIFSGHRGIGKTTVARILAKAMNCHNAPGPTPTPCGECDSCREIRDGNAVDVIEIDAASNRGIDEIRTLRENVRYRPARDRYKFFILDEAHQLTDDAFNALLKTLEEPPEWAVFVLATTEPEALPPTIRSRCQHFSFRAVPFPLIVGRLREICAAEGIPAEAESLGMIAEAGEGSLRDALSLLDQAIAYGDGKISAESTRALLGRVSTARMVELIDAVAADSSQQLLRLTHALLSAGVSPAQLCHQLVHFVRNALVCQVAGKQTELVELTDQERDAVAGVAERFSEEDLTRFLQILLKTAADLRHAQQERLQLELGLLKLVHARRLARVEEVIAALEGDTRLEAAAAPAPGTGTGTAPARPALTPPASRPEPPHSSAAAPPSRAGRELSFSPSPLASPAPDPAPSGEKKNARMAPSEPLNRVFSLTRPKIESEAQAPELAPHPADAGWEPPVAEFDDEDDRADDGGDTLDRLGDGAVPPPASPGTPAGSAASHTQTVLQWLTSQKKTSILSILGKAEWRWQQGQLQLVFGGTAAALATLADNEDVRKGLREACRQALGFSPEIGIVRQEEATAGAPAHAVLPGTAEERAQNHPMLRRLRERVPAHVLRTVEIHRR